MQGTNPITMLCIYSTTVVTCDENWGENIIWEKENRI